MKQHTRSFHVLMTILIMVFIFIQSSFPADLSTKESNIIVLTLSRWLNADADMMSHIIRKSAHFLEYLLLGISLHLTILDYADPTPAKRNSIISILISGGIGAAYALTDELHQLFVPGRSCELRDLLIDICGLALGVIIINIFACLRKM